MKKLTVFVSFSPKEIELVTNTLPKRTEKREFLGFWPEMKRGLQEGVCTHIADKINSFLKTAKEELLFGCDQKDLDWILKGIRKDEFDLLVMTSADFERLRYGTFLQTRKEREEKEAVRVRKWNRVIKTINVLAVVFHLHVSVPMGCFGVFTFSLMESFSGMDSLPSVIWSLLLVLVPVLAFLSIGISERLKRKGLFVASLVIHLLPFRCFAWTVVAYFCMF